MAMDKIVIRGARAHNLQNINVTIPKDKLVVMTGLSGSGKSSLAFDTLYAEGQRRYVESLSSYARRFQLTRKPLPRIRVQRLGRLPKLTIISVCYGQESGYRSVQMTARLFLVSLSIK
ncbi:UvrABC system protein A [Lentilactobacillus parabuchneri]|nr:UvrABC system protein A [Lentilactobacillus parabuchneri]